MALDQIDINILPNLNFAEAISNSCIWVEFIPVPRVQTRPFIPFKLFPMLGSWVGTLPQGEFHPLGLRMTTQLKCKWPKASFRMQRNLRLAISNHIIGASNPVSKESVRKLLVDNYRRVSPWRKLSVPLTGTINLILTLLRFEKFLACFPRFV